MSLKFKQNCLKGTFLLGFMLMFQLSYSQYNFDKVEDWMEEHLKDLGGRAVLMVYKDGKIVYENNENHLSSRQKKIGKFIAKRKGVEINQDDFTPDTKVRIASCSKWLTAALVMTFVDEGKLRLEDTIGKFLPVMSEYGKGHIKIWQCLSHLTGIKAGSLKESLQEFKKIKSMDEAVAEIASQPMEGEPGKTFHYSNIGLQLAGAVIEKISGKSFETLFAERIAQPCNMFNTDFGKGAVALPAGGAWSTANDYTRFSQMILNEGTFNGKQILSKNSIIEMQKNRVTADTKIMGSPAEAGNWGYGFGEWVMDDIGSENRSDAVTSPGLFGSFPWVDNKKQYTGFLMTFNLKNKGRNEKYKELKKLVDEALANN